MSGKIFKKIQEMKKEMVIKYNLEQDNSVNNVVKAIKEISTKQKRKFDESVDIVIGLNINLKKDQGVKGNCSLPFGNGKSIKVAVFTDSANPVPEADITGGEELIQKIKDGEKFEVDKCIATPGMMLKLSKIASILGKRGLMPNPKHGTVTDDVERVVKEIKKGMVFFNNDKTGYIHAGVGRVSFTEDQLIENIQDFIIQIKKFNKNPKTPFFKSIYLSTTMGISFSINSKQ